MRDNSLFDIVKNTYSDLFKDKDFYLTKLKDDWKNIAPSSWQGAIPMKIQWNKNNQGIITVHVDNHFITKLLLHEKDILLEKVNSYFGYKCIIDIKFSY